MSLRNAAARIGWQPPQFFLDGEIPGLSATDAALFRTRLFDLLSVLVHDTGVGPFVIRTGYPPAPAESAATPSGEADSPRLEAIDPVHTFDQLVLPAATREQLLDYVSLVEVAPLVFGKWNLRAIEPNPSTAVSFRGPPGTGKTLAAHAIAHRLGRKILLSRLSELESKFHGDGPKNLVQLFRSARAAGAVLFIDEAESLLSRRFAQPDQAAESAINSMRTELLMALDAYDGIIIFASNLPHSYDPAIESRLLHVDFGVPDRAARAQLWRRHLPPGLPLAADVHVERLADVDGLTGRDIKMAVISAAVSTARRGASVITQAQLEQAAVRQRDMRSTAHPHLDGAATAAVQDAIRDQLQAGVATSA